jgi:CIC family chloride channel protein
VSLRPPIGRAVALGDTPQSPPTGTISAPELTNDANALPALPIASVTDQGLTVPVMERSILTEEVARRGDHACRGYGSTPWSS